MAEKLHLRYHDRVVLVTKNGEEFTATLVGLFASGFNAKDEREAILNLALAQRMEGDCVKFGERYRAANRAGGAGGQNGGAGAVGHRLQKVRAGTRPTAM